jgi:carbohydrate-selective porin OprB
VAAARQRYPENQTAHFAPHSESILELTYLAPLTDHWEVQPNLQVIFHPGANAEVDSAIVFSLRTVLRF